MNFIKVWMFLLIALLSCNDDGKIASKKLDCLPLEPSYTFLFFEKGFDGDSMNVYVNDTLFESRVLTTDDILDLAGEVQIKSSGVYNISISINEREISSFCPYPFVKFNLINGKVKIDVAESPTKYQ